MAQAVVNVDNPRLGQDIFEARLTEVLLNRGLVTPEGLQESLRQQVLLGGHLATNLWELHFVEGKELTQISAELLNISVADPRDISNASCDVRRLFTRDFIDQLRVLPIRVVGSVLQVATAEPWDLLTLGRAAYHCGYPVEPFFLAEVPLAALMEKIYGIPTTARFWFGVQSNERRSAKPGRSEGGNEAGGEAVGETGRAVASKADAPAPGSGLLAAVHREISKIRRGRQRPMPGSLRADDPARPVEFAKPLPAAGVAGDRLIERGAADEGASALPPIPYELATDEPADRSLTSAQFEASVGIAPEAAISAAVAAAAASTMRAAPASTMAPAYQPPPVSQRLIVAPLSSAEAAAIEAPPAPIATLEEASAMLAEAHDRDEVGRIFLRLALSKARRVIVFVRRSLLWAGWMGAGEGVNVAYLHTLLMPTAPGTIFGLVANTGAHFIGPLAPSPSYAPFLAALGGGRPSTAALLPVHFHGRLIFGIYLDGGAQKRVTADIGDLVVLAQRIPVALERLIHDRVHPRAQCQRPLL